MPLQAPYNPKPPIWHLIAMIAIWPLTLIAVIAITISNRQRAMRMSMGSIMGINLEILFGIQNFNFSWGQFQFMNITTVEAHAVHAKYKVRGVYEAYSIFAVRVLFLQ
jgi:hypothetical protein